MKPVVIVLFVIANFILYPFVWGVSVGVGLSPGFATPLIAGVAWLFPKHISLIATLLCAICLGAVADLVEGPSVAPWIYYAPGIIAVSRMLRRYFYLDGFLRWFALAFFTAVTYRFLWTCWAADIGIAMDDLIRHGVQSLVINGVVGLIWLRLFRTADRQDTGYLDDVEAEWLCHTPR